jgi:hypothetical protein
MRSWRHIAAFRRQKPLTVPSSLRPEPHAMTLEQAVTEALEDPDSEAITRGT